MNTQRVLIMEEDLTLRQGRLANVEAVLRQAPEPDQAARRVKLPNGIADLAQSEICHTNGQRCELSKRETQLLAYLAANPGRAISRDEILLQVWRLNPRRMITRTIDMHIANLREKLGDDPHDPKVLLTVRGQGYMFAAPTGNDRR